MSIEDDFKDFPISNEKFPRRRGKLKDREIDGVKERFCSTCSKWMSLESFGTTMQSNVHGGIRYPRRQSSCHECQRKKGRQYYRRRKQLKAAKDV